MPFLQWAASCPESPDPTLLDLLARHQGGIGITVLLCRATDCLRQRQWACAERFAAEALDFCWDRLHEGFWECVPPVWRGAYLCASLLKAFADLTATGAACEAVQRVIWTLDQGLLLGGTGTYYEQVQDLVEVVPDAVLCYPLYLTSGLVRAVHCCTNS